MDDQTSKGGRPSVYSDALADIICERIADGESLRSICSPDDMPNKSTVFRWLEDDAGFATRYTRAREAQGDSLFDDILDIADDGRNDWMEKRASDGENIGWQENGEALKRSQMRIEARKWMAMKLRPKKYGEKVTSEITGADGGPIDLNLSPVETARRIAFMLAQGQSELERIEAKRPAE